MPVARPCVVPGCRERAVTSRARCKEHQAVQQSVEDERRKEVEPWRVFYKTQRWQKLRLKILGRDGNQCRWANERGVRCKIKVGLEINHLVPPSEGLTEYEQELLFFDETNLITACMTHHRLYDDERRRSKRAMASL